MKVLDPQLLNTLGVNLDRELQNEFIDYFQQTLEERVGLALIDLLDDAQAKELIQLSEQEDKSKLDQWLNTNIADYQEIVKDEYNILLDELLNSADQV